MNDDLKDQREPNKDENQGNTFQEEDSKKESMPVDGVGHKPDLYENSPGEIPVPEEKSVADESNWKEPNEDDAAKPDDSSQT
jgi:hypothetical protein